MSDQSETNNAPQNADTTASPVAESIPLDDNGGPSPEIARLFPNLIAEGEHTAPATSTGTFQQVLAKAGLSNVSQRALVTAVIVITGGATLYGMRTVGLGVDVAIAEVGTGDIAATPDDSKVDPVEFADAMDSLDASAKPMQVPVALLEPGAIRSAGQMLDDEEAERDRLANASGRSAELERRRRVEQALEGLRLEAIAIGSRPVAQIGGKLFRPGDEIVPGLVMTRISERSVELQAGEDLMTLEMKRPGINVASATGGGLGD